MVMADVPPALIVVGLNALLMVGAVKGAAAVPEAEVPVPAVVVWVVVTPVALIENAPALVADAVKYSVQPDAGIVIPVKLTDVAAADSDVGETPVVAKQVP
jgi:hypothetical protein